MATFEFKGLDEYMDKLRQMGEHAEGICKAAVYDGAAEVLHAIEAEMDGLQPTKGIDAASIQGLREGIGVAKMQSDASGINTKISWTGYNASRTKKYPNGKPNILIARTLVRGTSYRTKNDFVGRAVRRAKDPAIKAMRAKIEEMTNNMMK